MTAELKGEAAALDPAVTARYEAQARKLVGVLDRFRQAVMWDSMDVTDLRLIADDIRALRDLLPPRRRVFGEWRKANLLRRQIDTGSSMIGAAVQSGHFARLDPVTVDRLHVALDAAAAALMARADDDALLDKIEKLGRTEGRTDAEIRTAVEAVERLTSRRRFA